MPKREKKPSRPEQARMRECFEDTLANNPEYINLSKKCADSFQTVKTALGENAVTALLDYDEYCADKEQLLISLISK